MSAYGGCDKRVHARMKYRIVKMSESRTRAYYAAFDQVARERMYFPQMKAPPLKDVRKFVRAIISGKDLQFVALAGDAVIGWCDIVRARHEARRHAGLLAIGVVRQYRRHGIGADLMKRAIAAAWKRRFTRIELTVRADNHAAIALYERMGFTKEGAHRKAIRVDGKYFDQLTMALICEDV